MPADFIPIAEEIGLIVPIGEWVIRRACQDATAWPDTIRVAVNLSPTQLNNSLLFPTVLTALNAAQLPAHRLELEITEAVLMENTEANFAGRCTACARSASASRWTISVPATRH